MAKGLRNVSFLIRSGHESVSLDGPKRLPNWFISYVLARSRQNDYGDRLDGMERLVEPLKQQDEPIHSPVTVTILDTVTGETHTNSEWSPWYWAYGNGSCDCNRGALFGNEEGCGERRYYIVAVEGDESGYELAEDYNHLYPPIPPKCPLGSVAGHCNPPPASLEPVA